MADLELLSTEAVQATTISGLSAIAIRQLDTNDDPITTGGWIVQTDPDYGFIANWVPEMFFINFIDGFQILKVRWTHDKAHWMLSQWAVAAGNTTGCYIHVGNPKP